MRRTAGTRKGRAAALFAEQVRSGHPDLVEQVHEAIQQFLATSPEG